MVLSQTEKMYSRKRKMPVSVLDSDHNYGDMILVNQNTCQE